MAGSNSIVIVGQKEAIRDLARRGDRVKVEVKKLNLEAARDVAREAQRHVPRQSGRLASSIRAAGQLRQGVVRVGSASVPYAGPIHFGWRRRGHKWGVPGQVGGGPITANPFLYDAAALRRADVTRRYAEALNALLRRH